MNSLSVKEYLSLKMPTEEAPVSDQSRILLALSTLGYEHVTIPLHILRNLYPPGGGSKTGRDHRRCRRC